MESVRLEKVTVAYQWKPVLWEVDLSLPRGKMIAIIGPNGAGKSTLLKTILGLIKPVKGQIILPQEGEKNLVYVPQHTSVDWDFPATVRDVVVMGAYGKLGLFRPVGRREKEEALEKLELVGMGAYAKRHIAQLSGGQQQRVFLARALMQEGSLYLFDEPFKGVDIQTEQILVTLLKNMVDEGKTVVVVHHDLSTVTDYFQWVVLLNERLLASGDVATVFTEENVWKTYGVKGLQWKNKS